MADLDCDSEVATLILEELRFEGRLLMSAIQGCIVFLRAKADNGEVFL